MSILDYLKGLFRKPAARNASSLYHADAEQFREQHAAYLAQKAAAIAEEPRTWAGHYGNFHPFLYRPDFDSFLKTDVLPSWAHTRDAAHAFDTDHWARKHPFNFPGPFYTGESDTCGTGINEAPDNVGQDNYCCEFIFRQPRDYPEFLRVVDAAAVEVLESYSANGNKHWTYALCRDWWRARGQMQQALAQPAVQAADSGQARAYLAYLAGSAETDLRRYCYFLEHGHYPAADTSVLPSL